VNANKGRRKYLQHKQNEDNACEIIHKENTLIFLKFYFSHYTPNLN